MSERNTIIHLPYDDPRVGKRHPDGGISQRPKTDLAGQPYVAGTRPVWQDGDCFVVLPLGGLPMDTELAIDRPVVEKPSKGNKKSEVDDHDEPQ